MASPVVCHIPPPTTVEDQPSPLALPSIPPAQPNLQSLVNTVNAMRQVLMIYTGQASPGPPGSPGQAGQGSGSWTQKKAVINTVRIFQNNDPTSPNFVDVNYVSELIMGNNASASQSWTYKAPPNAGGQ